MVRCAFLPREISLLVQNSHNLLRLEVNS